MYRRFVFTAILLGLLNAHAMPMKPDEFKAILKKIVVKPFDPPKS
jgi:hypothetical protein